MKRYKLVLFSFYGMVLTAVLLILFSIYFLIALHYEVPFHENLRSHYQYRPSDSWYPSRPPRIFRGHPAVIVVGPAIAGFIILYMLYVGYKKGS